MYYLIELKISIPQPTVNSRQSKNPLWALYILFVVYKIRPKSMCLRLQIPAYACFGSKTLLKYR